MATIGIFTATESGYTGRIETLTFTTQVVLVKQKKLKDKQPDYTVSTSLGRHIGAAWERLGFISVQITDPSFQPGSCILRKEQDGSDYRLTFQHRRDKKAEQ